MRGDSTVEEFSLSGSKWRDLHKLTLSGATLRDLWGETSLTSGPYKKKSAKFSVAKALGIG